MECYHLGTRLVPVVVGRPQNIVVGLESLHACGCLPPGCHLPQERLFWNSREDLVDTFAHRLGLVLGEDLVPEACEHRLPECLLVVGVGDQVEPFVLPVLGHRHLHRE